MTDGLTGGETLTLRRVSHQKALGKLVLTLLVFLLGAAVIVEPIRTWALWRVAHLGSGPTCQDPGWLEPVALLNAQATSNLATDEGVTYFPGNSADGDLATAWVAMQQNDGSSLSISWTLAKADVVCLVCVTPGYAKSEDRFKNNRRLKRFELSMNGERHVVPVPPIETRSYQTRVTVATSCMDCERIEVTILETYPTEKGGSEVAISEVTAYKDPRVWPLRLLPW